VILSRRPLERLYVEERLSMTEVGRLFEVTHEVVARNLDRHGIPRLRPPLDRDTLEELYVNQRLGLRDVAARLGVTTTRADLAHHGFPIRAPGRPPSATRQGPVLG
jgi:hypothetical protein